MNTVLRTPGGDLLPIEGVDRVSGDRDHVAGAILLTVGYRPILTAELWDDIDDLWAYLLTTCERCRNQGEASTYFPDQPIKIALRLLGSDQLEIEVSNLPGADRRARAPRDEFFSAVLAAGQVFFERMSDLLPEHADSYRPSLDLIRMWPLDVS